MNMVMTEKRTRSNLRWRYRAFTEMGCIDDAGEYNTYGIQIISDEGYELLHDVSTDIEVIRKMIFMFNQYQLSPIHIKDAIEDFLP